MPTWDFGTATAIAILDQRSIFRFRVKLTQSIPCFIEVDQVLALLAAFYKQIFAVLGAPQPTEAPVRRTECPVAFRVDAAHLLNESPLTWQKST